MRTAAAYRAAVASAPSSEWRRVTSTVGEARLLPHEHQQNKTTSYSAGWHSPVPYLFGGLAAMLGLIAFALLVLACSYLKLSGYPPEGEVDDVESGAGGGKAAAERGEGGRRLEAYWSVLVVTMPGQVKPSFLATPAMSKAVSSSSINVSSDVQMGRAGEDRVRRGSRGEDAPHPPQHSGGGDVAAV